MTLVWKSGYSFDSDASTYIDAVETADGQALETGVRVAINDFVLGCKQDDIWNAIKASCILAGARTLDGALVPLTGGSPTNFNFVSADYDRKTGLVGDGSTKFLDSGRAGNADPQDSVHFCVYKSSGTTTGTMIGSVLNNFNPSTFNLIGYDNTSNSFRFVCRGGLSSVSGAATAIGFFGVGRSLSATYTRRFLSSSSSVTSTSTAASDRNFFVFNQSGNNNYDASRLAFYSIGESLDLALLDTRVSNLMTAIGAAIP